MQTEGGSMLRPELRPQYLVRFVPNAKQKILGVLFVAFESSMWLECFTELKSHLAIIVSKIL